MSNNYELLVVVGFGAAGAAAAITAAERGARVLLHEKAPEDRHPSNTRMSGGLIMTVNDADAATEYLMHYHDDAGDDHGDYKGDVDGFVSWLSERHATIEKSTHFLWAVRCSTS